MKVVHSMANGENGNIKAMMWNLYMRTKHSPREYLYRFPQTFKVVASMNRKKQHIFVKPDTEVIIEGYPRSANTFAHVAFEFAQNRPVKIASHFHASGQVILGIKYKIPTLVLIRKPVDAIASLLVREHYLTVRQAINWYVGFYQSLVPYINDMVIADFSEVITDYGSVISKFNHFYGTKFSVFEHTEQNVQECFRKIEDIDRKTSQRSSVTETGVARPSDKRKEVIKEKKKDVLQSPYQSLLSQTHMLYDRFSQVV